MKIKQLLTKTLLVVVCLLVGQSAWANDTFGNTSTTTWWEDGQFSQDYTLTGYGTYNFTFTTTNANDGTSHYTWVLVATNGANSHGGEGTEYFAWRGDSYAWSGANNSNNNSSLLKCSSTYAGSNLQAAMNGATVDMTVTRTSYNISALATVKPINGDSKFTMSFNYNGGNATSENIGLFFTVQGAAMDITSARQTYSTAWNNLFDNSGTYRDGWSGAKSRSQSNCEVSQVTRIGDEKYVYFDNKAYNTVWTYTLSDISAISSATDYIYDMDFALVRCNTNGTTGMKITNASNDEIFKVLAPGGDTGKGSSTLVSGSVYINGNSTAESETVTMNTFRGGDIQWYNIHITSNATDGTDLTLTKCSDATETTTYHLSNDVVALGKVILDAGYGWTGVNQGYYGSGAFDNFVLMTPVDEASVSEPTVNITDFDLTSRTIELSTLTDGATIYYSETSSDPEESSAWSEYTGAFATTATPIYAYAKKGEYSSTVATLATGAGTAFTLNTPSIMRTGATTYRVTASATSALGVTATQTIHYTVNGGAEKTADSPAEINDVNGDVVAWTTAAKFSTSAEAQATYVKAYDLASEPTWAYNLNSYPSAHSCTSINDALTTTGKDIQGTTMYNLKEENYPNLYIENATGWYLRNQASNAFKCQSARTSIGFDNVTTTDVIYVQVSNDDASKNSIYSVSNGTVKYNYSLGKFYIVPTEDGAVKVTFQTGSSVQTVGVYSQIAPVTITEAGWATLYTPYALDFSSLSENLTAYTATLDGSTVKLTSVDNVPANTGVVLEGTAGNYSIPVIASSETEKGDLDGNATAATAYDAFVNTKLYILTLIDNNNVQFNPCTSGEIAPGKAFLKVAIGGAKALSVMFANDPTGIATVNAAEVAQPAKRIVNGQLVIEKNGKRYNAAGAEF